MTKLWKKGDSFNGENEVGLGISPIKWKFGEALSNTFISWGQEIYLGLGIGGEISIKLGKAIDIMGSEIEESWKGWMSNKCKWGGDNFEKRKF